MSFWWGMQVHVPDLNPFHHTHCEQIPLKCSRILIIGLGRSSRQVTEGLSGQSASTSMSATPTFALTLRWTARHLLSTAYACIITSLSATGCKKHYQSVNWASFSSGAVFEGLQSFLLPAGKTQSAMMTSHV